MQSPRNVKNVLKEVLEIIPESNVTLIDELINFDKNLFNQDPYALTTSYIWSKFIYIFNKNIPLMEEPWHFQLQKILANEKQT
jgi:hypothetical protein